MNNTDLIRNHWNGRSDEYYRQDYESSKALEAITAAPERAFPIELYPVIRHYFPDLTGKRICVPSSGDNAAVFGFHLLGARVTSCDLSERQLYNAKVIADRYGWDIRFVCDDSRELAKLPDDGFDLVYTSNGVHVWIDDLPRMYRSFRRILKAGGYSIFFETHPMTRPFDNHSYDVKIRKPYEDVGPFGEVPTYGWRTQDFVNAVLKAGLTLREMLEFHSRRDDLYSHNYLYVGDNENYSWPGDTWDWEVNPWAALPQCLSLVSQKV